ncbi:MAG: hypothetical protein MJY85_05060 [Fibrobacter sp.]|nr:hypothetical protein [Fibrobacter sp.]
MDQKNKSIADTFNSRVKTPWVWLVLAITVGLTILFYFSQKPQIVMYSRYMKNLSDYQLQESYTMRAMDRIRTGFGGDTVLIQAQTMTLREMAVSFSKEMDEINALGVQAPSQSSVQRFEKEVLSKVAGMRRYASTRTTWFNGYNKLDQQILNMTPSAQSRLRLKLDSARAGLVVFLMADDPEIVSLPDSLKVELTALFRANEELAMAWTRLSSDMAVMYSEDLIQYFRSANLNEISLKSKIPMAFYFLSLVLLLSTFFFIFRSRQ